MSSDSSSDNLDIAAELQQLSNDSAIAEVRKRGAPEKHPDFDGEHCIACGEDIPLARLLMFRIRCVFCQAEKEKKERK